MKIPLVTKNWYILGLLFSTHKIAVCFERYIIRPDLKLNESYVTSQLGDVSKMTCVGRCAQDIACKGASWNLGIQQCFLSEEGTNNGDEGIFELVAGWLTFSKCDGSQTVVIYEQDILTPVVLDPKTASYGGSTFAHGCWRSPDRWEGFWETEKQHGFYVRINDSRWDEYLSGTFQKPLYQI